MRQRLHIQRHGKISPGCLSLFRLVSVLYFTRVGSQFPGRGTQHRTGVRDIGASILLACKPSQQSSYRCLVSATAHNKAVQLEDPSKAPPPTSVILNPAVAVSAPLGRLPRAPVRPCHATRRLALQLAAGTGGSFTSTISGSLMSPALPIPQSPHIRYFLQKEDSLLSPT